jgi:hypothetical protein
MAPVTRGYLPPEVQPNNPDSRWLKDKTSYLLP